MRDVLVIGGGIVGCLVALECHFRGGDVTVLDAGPGRSGASWAGGGILSPMFPWRYTRELNALAEPGNEAYAGLAERFQASGHMDDSVFHRSGIWMELLPQEQTAFDTWSAYTCQQFRHESRVVNGEERHGVFFPRLGSIRSPRMMRSLRDYLRSRGVSFYRARALGWEQRADVVVVGLDDETTIRCRSLVIAAGAWSSALLKTPAEQFPVKGEMLMYRLGDAAPKELILSREGYAIPRRNGDTVVGSTLRVGDGSGYPTVAGRYHLERVAETFLPQCRGLRPASHWAGVRPGLDRDYPYIGAVPGEKNVYAAIGHYRNGLVCAPETAAMLADIMCGKTPGLDAAAYSMPSSRSSSSFLSR